MISPKTTVRRLSPLAPLLVFAAGAAIAAPANVDGPALSRANLTPDETRVAARQATDKMEDTLRRSVEISNLARKQKDIIRIDCLTNNQKLIKGFIEMSNGAIAKLNEEIAKNNAEGIAHEYTRVKIIAQKVSVLSTEAENCIGEDLTYTGSLKVTVLIDPSIPPGDPTDTGLPGLPTGRPPSLSPIL